MWTLCFDTVKKTFFLFFYSDRTSSWIQHKYLVFQIRQNFYSSKRVTRFNILCLVSSCLQMTDLAAMCCYCHRDPIDFGGMLHKSTASSVLSRTDPFAEDDGWQEIMAGSFLSTHIVIESTFFFFCRRWPLTQTNQPSHSCHVQIPTSFQQQSQSALPCYGRAGERAWEFLLPTNTRQCGAEEEFTAGLYWMAECKSK